jgi:hypothetical protein
MRTNLYAPWSTKLKLTTAGFLLIILVAMYAIQGWGSLLLVGTLLVGATFAIRGHSLHEGKLFIHRLGWSTKYDLTRLVDLEVRPGATMGSARVMGIGGLFGFVGHFRNEVLGSYQAYATNEFNTVILDFGGTRIVVTPDRPGEFAESVRSARSELLAAAADDHEN